MVKSPGKCGLVTPRERNMMCGESNEINKKKIVLSFTAQKKIVCLSWESKKKSLTTKEKP